MGSELAFLRIGSLVCIAATLCAIFFVRSRRRSLVGACGIIVTAVSLLIVTDVIVAAVPAARERPMLAAQATPPTAVATSTPAVTPAATRTPDPAGIRTEALRSFETSWTTIVRLSVAAIRAHDAAGESLRIGNSAAAIDDLKNCQATATGIVADPVKLALDAAHESDVELLTVIRKIGDGLTQGCKSARSYLETNAAADFAATNEHFSGVAAAIVRSETLARSKYQSLGGNPDSLPSFKTALR